LKAERLATAQRRLQFVRENSQLSRARRDCLKSFAARVTQAGVIGSEELEAIDREVGRLIDEAVASAKAAPLPTLRDLVTDVYVSY
jgi:TPP-dependent pyruvate/acetoin dehydrogenase alpha subunit